MSTCGHQTIEITRFGDRHRHYYCSACGAMTVCLHDDLNPSRIGNALDCQQCITEAEETAQP